MANTPSLPLADCLRRLTASSATREEKDARLREAADLLDAFADALNGCLAFVRHVGGAKGAVYRAEQLMIRARATLDPPQE